MRLRSSSLSLLRSSSKLPMSSKVFLVPAVGFGLPSSEGVKLYRLWCLLYGFIDVHREGDRVGD